MLCIQTIGFQVAWLNTIFEYVIERCFRAASKEKNSSMNSHDEDVISIKLIRAPVEIVSSKSKLIFSSVLLRIKPIWPLDGRNFFLPTVPITRWQPIRLLNWKYGAEFWHKMNHETVDCSHKNIAAKRRETNEHNYCYDDRSNSAFKKMFDV